MSFSYNLSTDVGKIRLNLGDKVENSGPFPDSTNFSDEELAQILLQEGSRVMLAVAACCEILANAWSAVPDLRVGPRDEGLGSRAKEFATRATNLRAQYGTPLVVSVQPQRGDGYQARTDVNTSSNDFGR